VAIGRSIVRDPKVYLFDEPLSNLDAALRVATRIEIAQLKEQMPESTMIYVTHDQVEAMTLATRIVVLAGGGIAQVGSPLTLYEKPASTFVAQFIGSPAMNLLGGKIVGTGETTTLELPEGGGTITSHYPSKPEDMGATVQVGIRPEDMVATDGDNYAFHGTVDIIEALGEVTQLYATRRPDRAVTDRIIDRSRDARAPISTACAAWPRRARAARTCPAATRPMPMPRWGATRTRWSPPAPPISASSPPITTC
jgi:alpha-glucoside transport system ATP-binding protein